MGIRKIPKNTNIVDFKWGFANKNDKFCNPKRYKARLVARGFTHYDGTFAPVAKVSNFPYIIPIADQFNLLLLHMDGKTAFLKGNVKDKIYIWKFIKV